MPIDQKHWHSPTADPSTVARQHQWRLLSNVALRDIAERIADGELPVAIARDYGITAFTLRHFKAWLLPSSQSAVHPSDGPDEFDFSAVALAERREFLREQLGELATAVATLERLRSAYEAKEERLLHTQAFEDREQLIATADRLASHIRDATERHDILIGFQDELVATAPGRLQRRYASLQRRLDDRKNDALRADMVLRSAVNALDRHAELSARASRNREERRHLNRSIAKWEKLIVEDDGVIAGMRQAVAERPQASLRRAIAERVRHRNDHRAKIRDAQARLARATKRSTPTDRAGRISRYHSLKKQVEICTQARDDARETVAQAAERMRAAFDDIIESDGTDGSQYSPAIRRALAHV